MSEELNERIKEISKNCNLNIERDKEWLKGNISLVLFVDVPRSDIGVLTAILFAILWF